MAHEPAPLAAEGPAKFTGHILIGSSVKADRTLHGVGGQFASSVPRVIAGMLIGDVPAGTDATITWSQETPDGERTLFTQQASLRAHGVLYATANGNGPVELGLYRVHISAAGDEHDALFVVVPAVLSPALPSTIAGQSGLMRTAPAGDSTGTVLTSGDVVVDDSPAPCSAQDSTDCTYWSSADDNGGETTVDTSPTTEPPPCPPPGTAHVSAVQEVWMAGAFVDLSTNSFSGRVDCPSGIVELSAAVNGADPASLRIAPNARWVGNTCDLPGASDLFGDTVTSTASVDGGSPRSTEIKLYEFGPVPNVVYATPPTGSRVKPGAKIAFYALAVVIGATHGIKSLVVTGPDGAEVARAGRDAPATACDESLSRFGVKAHVAYEVAQNPPPILEFLVSAETFDGSHAQFPVRYATKPTWSGTLKLTVDQDVPSSGHQHMEYGGDIAVAETGPNSLEGRMHGPWTQELDLLACPAETLTKGLVDVPLTGTINSLGMHLTLGQATATPPILTPCYGQQPGLMGNPLVFPQLATLLGQLDPQGDGRYTASVSVTEPGGGYPYTVNVDVKLHAGADVDPSSPAIDIGIAIP
ncbi:MAG: hypothetical protein QOI70_1284 [Microbacteriaceae bacterium]|nr:hypothetical protein [Microbacteriaceae bacterium]